MAYLIVISSGDLSQKLTEWKCNIQGLALPNTTLNQQTLKRNLNVTHLQCLMCSWHVLRRSSAC